MKLTYKIIDVTTVILYLTKGHIEDGVRVKLPRGVRHATAVKMVEDLIAAANKVLEGEPK
jgi:hypothetical protein